MVTLVTIMQKKLRTFYATSLTNFFQLEINHKFEITSQYHIFLICFFDWWFDGLSLLLEQVGIQVSFCESHEDITFVSGLHDLSLLLEQDGMQVTFLESHEDIPYVSALDGLSILLSNFGELCSVWESHEGVPTTGNRARWRNWIRKAGWRKGLQHVAGGWKVKIGLWSLKACFLISVVIFSHAVQLSGQNVRSCQSYDSFYSVVNKPLYELCK